jgi:CRP/FNR family cyclic AMP-dependent transcriptional regulator
MEANRLRSVPLFEELTDEELVRCAGQFEETLILAGSGMIREGDYSYRFFVVLEGAVDVLQDFDRIATLGPGDYFGEMGLVSGDRRNARVVAKDRCTVAQLMTWDFKAMADEFPSVGAHVEQTIVSRTHDTDD